jgi:hypothetical protein
MMTGQISSEQWIKELERKNYLARKQAEHHSNIKYVNLDITGNNWTVYYLESPKKGGIKVGKKKRFHAKSNKKEDIEAALEIAKNFASGVELGRPLKKQSSTKKTRKK